MHLAAVNTHQFDGNGNGAGRQGSKKTRYGAVPRNKGKNEIKANYYAITATEIFPIAVNTDHQRELMMVTARPSPGSTAPAIRSPSALLSRWKGTPAVPTHHYAR